MKVAALNRCLEFAFGGATSVRQFGRSLPRIRLILAGLAALPAACSNSTNPGPAAVTSAPFAASPASAPSSKGAQTLATWESFHETVEPVLALYCYPCHGPDRSEKGLRLDLFTDETALHARFDALNKALAMLYAAKMPPPCEYQPSTVEQEAVTGWIMAWQKQEIAAQTAR